MHCRTFAATIYILVIVATEGADPTTQGTFPFGRPNTSRPMRRPMSGRARALVVGVYPSAFHIAWSPPARHDPRPAEDRARPLVSSLAVDVEPVVFWDGTAPTAADELTRWKEAVSFDDDHHGAASVGHNGPSGIGVVKEMLTPLGIDAAEAAFTDVVPWFFVKQGKGSQGTRSRTGSTRRPRGSGAVSAIFLCVRRRRA